MNAELLEWLQRHDLERFAPVFDENEVDLPTLKLLSEEDLKELGLPFGPRKRILTVLREEQGTGRAANFVGAPLGERRQLTVMFCDMVGFTGLSQRLDPETLQVVIRAYEDACATCIVQYEGYVFTCLGDGVVALFGFPLAHEGEASRAIRSALDIVASIGKLKLPMPDRLRVRIGIATGIVVVSTGERNAVGETMNLASRLQTIAEPGSVVVSERTRRLAGGEFVFESVGPKALKGVSGSPEVYRVVGVSGAESRFEAATQTRMTPLVGRDEEERTLLEAWREVTEAGSGRLVVLAGEPGIGKSRIVSAMRDRLQCESMRTILFQCSPFFTNTAFYPIKASLERAAEFLGEDDPPKKLDKLEARFAQRLNIPRGDLRFLAAMLGLPYHDRYGPIPVSPKLAKEETMRALIEVLRAEAGDDGALLIVEDAHWADPTTIDFLKRLAEKLSSFAALLIVTARPEFRSPWRGRPGTITIDLARLTGEESRAIVARLAGGKALPPGLEAQIVNRADGVPLFLEELTKTILESGSLVLSGDRYTYSDSEGNVTIPETLRDSLMARLDRAPAAKEIAQIGAVIGREFSYELISALHATPEESLDSGLRLLAGSGLAVCHGGIPNAVFSFSHALVQDAAYDSILKSRRRQLHADIARVIDERWPATRDSSPELLAYHHNAAGQHELAAPLWLHAGVVAVQRFALPEAISHLRIGTAALMNTQPSKTRDLLELSFRTTLGPALVAHRGWGHEEVSTTLETAWELAQSLGHHSSYLPILNALAVHHMCINQLQESLRWTERLLSAGERLGDQGLQIIGYRAASAVHYWRGDFADAKRAGDEVHRLYDPEKHYGLALLTNNDPFTGEGVYRSQYLWIMGYPDQAGAAHRATEANARRRNHPFDIAFALTLGAQVFDFLSDSEALLRRTEEAERVGREHGLTLLSEIMAEISRGVAWLRADRPADGAAQLDRSIARLSGTGHQIWIWYLRALQAEGLAKTGDLKTAWALIEESVKRIEAGEERSHYAEVLRLQGWLLEELGDPEAGGAALRKAILVAQKQGAKSWELRSAATLARLLAREGRKTEAIAVLSPVRSWFTEGLDTKDLMDADRLLAQLQGAAPRLAPAAQ